MLLIVSACGLAVAPSSWVRLSPEQLSLAARICWGLVALTALISLAWTTAPGADFVLGLRTGAQEAIFLFPFAMTGLFIEVSDDRFGRRVTFACAMASLGALSVEPWLLAMTGAGAQMLLFSSRQSLFGSGLRSLLFVASCAPGTGWIACIPALVSGCAAAPGRGAFALAPSLEMGCSLLVLSRNGLHTQNTSIRQMAGLLLVGGVILGITRATDALFTRRASTAFGGIFALTHVLAVIASGLYLLAIAADSPLSAHAALSAFVVDLICVWPVAIALLYLGDHVVRSGGSDRLSLLGGLGLFAPRLTGAFAVAMCVMALLPPAAGFSVLWLVVTTALALLPEGYAPALPSITFLAGFGVVVTLFCLAILRLVILVVFGVPRSPRMAASTDVSMSVMQPVLICLFISGIMSVFPGMVTFQATGIGAPFHDEHSTIVTSSSFVTLVGPDGLSSWTPIAVTFMLAAIAVPVVLLRRRTPRQPLPSSLPRKIFPDVSATGEMPWSGGLKWRSSCLPFGEPLLWPGTDMASAILKQAVPALPAFISNARSYIRKTLFLTPRLLRFVLCRIHTIETHGLAVVLLIIAAGLWFAALRL
ncbi:hypothetical protein [Acetobacter oeni]|uniref:NADH:quinone oxidoreductase/Mrp antiporter membrane subunit domain-containing protein n=1 Tax=Acetobacter oeni TaxID=304077 RepID=A0A511XGG0_9PROT|nr:hypothetical protein [Acetobacter oeni]MBB3881793.1 hypothetical protein [Acetobacter oeni]NHO17405.1 hypothetical protein [Acetobacter oeni]GEN62033.1 hypothetical protein AOE01nite_02570 [Acetobacter oeni]